MVKNMTTRAAASSAEPSPTTTNDSRAAAARRRLAGAVLSHLLDGGSPEGSLRSFASAVGVSHSLLLYHFGSASGLLAAVHIACEQREREHLAELRVSGTQPVHIMRAMWQHLAQPRMWPVYRLGFALRLRTDVLADGRHTEREAWVTALEPLASALELEPARVRDESLLWVATCRGLLWELVTGADPERVDQAAERFFARYEPRSPRR